VVNCAPSGTATLTGTIDFRHDTVNDIVIVRPRWTLDTPVEVTRWYEMHVRYFAGRFQGPKDVIVLNAAFDVTAKVASLWGQYRARLHETYIRFSIRVNSNPRVLASTATSAVRHSLTSVATLEAASMEEATAVILEARERANPARAGSGTRPRTPPEAFETSPLKKAQSSRPPKG
jgi:hypothetical protein